MHPLARAAALALPLLAAACAQAPVAVPPALQPPGGGAPLATLHARGVQIYACRARAGDAAASEWAFVAPEAELFDGAGRRIGSHGAGPHWLHDDGSRIVGSVKARADAPLAGAIPWLLLEARSTGGEGAFSRVGHVQRVKTEGGSAPAGGCGTAERGRELRVPYTADYVLLGRP